MVGYEIFVVVFIVSNCRICQSQNNTTSAPTYSRSFSTPATGIIDKGNFTCGDQCFDELSNFVARLHSNTSIRIVPDIGAPKGILIKIDPVDFVKICQIYSKTVPCLKNCKESDASSLLALFKDLTFYCIDEFQEIKKHYKCIYESTIENPKVDECTVECLENVTKSNKLIKKTNSTLDTCSPIRCAAMCSVKFARKQCDPETVAVIRKSFKYQLDVSSKFEGWKEQWPKDCSQLFTDLDSNRLF